MNETNINMTLHSITKAKGILNITFEQKNIMQQLPFTQFGFELYDNEKITKLTGTTPFKIIGSATKIETTKSETGDLVNKEYTTVTLKK
jgi:septin family protein